MDQGPSSSPLKDVCFPGSQSFLPSTVWNSFTISLLLEVALKRCHSHSYPVCLPFFKPHLKNPPRFMNGPVFNSVETAWAAQSFFSLLSNFPCHAEVHVSSRARLSGGRPDRTRRPAWPHPRVGLCMQACPQ